MTTIATATRRAFGYCRVSSTNQVGERHVSLETQQARFQEYCAAKGYHPLLTFTDVASGRKDDRREYQRMLALLRGGEADVVVVQFVDRFGRKPREMLRRIWELEERRIGVEATDEDIREEMVLLVRAGIAGAESRRISERVSSNIWRKVGQGVKFGRPPYGYKSARGKADPKTGRAAVDHFVQDTDEVAVIRAMYDMAVKANYGAKRTADALNAQGYRTRQGGPWSTPSVLQVLYNVANIGTLAYGRRVKDANKARGETAKEGVYPAIFTPDEWAALQARRQIHRELSRGRARSSDYLLSGIAKCGECGASLAGKKSSSRGRVTQRYVCAARHQSRAACPNGRTCDAAALEKAVLTYLGTFSDPEAVRALLAATDASARARAEAEYEGVANRLAELEAAMLADMDRLDRKVYSEAEYLRRAESRRSEEAWLRARETELRQKLEAERKANDQAERIPGAIRSFFEDFSTLPVQRQKALLQGIVKAAHVYRDGRIELEFRDG